MKLESRPIDGKSWEYRFFVDFTGDVTAPGMDGVLSGAVPGVGDLPRAGELQRKR